MWNMDEIMMTYTKMKKNLFTRHQPLLSVEALNEFTHTVLPAKSDNDFMFCLQSYQGIIIDRSLVCQSYPQDRRINTQVIYRFA